MAARYITNMTFSFHKSKMNESKNCNVVLSKKRTVQNICMLKLCYGGRGLTSTINKFPGIVHW